MKNRFFAAMENIVIVAILLALAQTFMEELIILTDETWALRKIFIFTGLGFDLFFTLEFLLRTWNALLNKRFRRYFLQENGWVDFAASIPLLVFSSIPEALAVLSGAAFTGAGTLIGTLKVVKTVRLARMLRLLRALKLFRHIRFANSAMAQRHTVRLATIITSTFVVAAMLLGAAFTFLPGFGIEEIWEMEQKIIRKELQDDPPWMASPSLAKTWGKTHPSVLLIKNQGVTLYTIDNEYLRRNFGPGDYLYFTSDEREIWLDQRPAAVTQSRINLTAFLSVLILMIAVIALYGPHFAMTVSDPVNVMLKGFKVKSFNSEVKIPDEFAHDDIFILADAYNESYLLLKEKGEVAALDISMEDISDLLKP